MQKYAQVKVKVETESQYQWKVEHKHIMQMAQHTKKKMQKYAQKRGKVD